MVEIRQNLLQFQAHWNDDEGVMDRFCENRHNLLGRRSRRDEGGTWGVVVAVVRQRRADRHGKGVVVPP